MRPSRSQPHRRHALNNLTARKTRTRLGHYPVWRHKIPNCLRCVLAPIRAEVVGPIAQAAGLLIVWRTCRQLLKLGHDLGVPLVRQHPVILALTQQNLEHHVGV